MLKVIKAYSTIHGLHRYSDYTDAEQVSLLNKWQQHKSTNPSKSSARWKSFLQTLAPHELEQLKTELPTWKAPPNVKSIMSRQLEESLAAGSVPAETIPAQSLQDNQTPTATDIQATPPEPSPSGSLSIAPPEQPPLSNAERIQQLEQIYQRTWNYYMDNLIPRLKDNVQQANALNRLFNEVRPVWKGLRQQIRQNPQFADRINVQHLDQANAALNSASKALEQLIQSDALLDNHVGNFQSQLTRAFNAIRQMSFANNLTDIQPTLTAAMGSTSCLFKN